MAAKTRTLLLSLAALCLPALANVPRASLLSEKPHQGVAGFVLASHWGAAAAKALSAPGLCGCLYDSGRRSRSTGKERDAETGLDYFGGRVSDRSDDQTPNQSLLARGTSTNLPSGLNPGDFISRYYSSAQGRFTSPDRPLLDQYSDDPQSWNLFSYVRNNPLTFFDLNGGECKKTKDGFEGDCVSPGDEKVTQGDKPQVENVNGQQGSLLDLFMASGVPRYVPDDKPLSDNVRKVLTVAYLRTQHDLGCVGLGGAITGGAGAASAPIIPKPFSQGGASSTSVASTVLGGGKLGTRVATPLGMPGTSSFAWRQSANVGRIAGRYLPYVGTVAGAAATYACLGSNP
jgi:RHS repeat-associated protein